MFLGRVYRTPVESLPWYNTLVWTLFVTPVGFLAFALAGVVRALAAIPRGNWGGVPRVRSSEPVSAMSARTGSADGTRGTQNGEYASEWYDRLAVLAVGHWAFLLLLRALPHTPGHDAERQILPAFGCLALVAGLGASWVVAKWGRGGRILVVAAILEGALSVAVMMPVPLSYYSPLVGGLPGAAALGMEPTYYWDALDDDALTWLNTHTPPGRSVLFATNPTSWLYLRDQARLKVPLAPFEAGEPLWYVVQNRPGALRPSERELHRAARAALCDPVEARRSPGLGVPLRGDRAMKTLSGRRWRLACLLVFLGALAAIVPTVGDFGLTYDEPAYRYSQEVSIQWWEQLARVRSQTDLARLLDPDALLYYWPYARHGINFHPPLGGQLNLLTYTLAGRWIQDIPARRLASALELAVTIALVFGFLARRYGFWAGLGAAGAILLTPRLYGQAHLIDTDTPGVLIWTAAALAFWKGLYEPRGGRWRVAVGVLAGLAFVEKMATVFVLLPLFAWLILARLPRTRRSDWIDGLVTTLAQLAPLAIVFREILRLARPAWMPLPKKTDLFLVRPSSALPGVILLAPLAVWLVRRLVGRWRNKSPVWGVERPALETWSAVLAFAPAVGWLGNPAWWRETLPRLAHYYLLNTSRRGSLPDIRILYMGQTYEYSLPWHNAWVLLAITVPASLLIAAGVGFVYAVRRIAGRDVFPLYVLAHLVTLPVLRMLPTPAHDGVRLFLPTFVFLSILAGWGVAWVGDGLARAARRGANGLHVLALLLVLGPAAWQLIRVHPYELSYYNEFIGGPRGAWRAGFELAYWYDAFTPGVIRQLNARFPRHATVTFPNELSAPIMVFQDLQALGALRGDIELEPPAGGVPLFLAAHARLEGRHVHTLTVLDAPVVCVAPPAA